MAFWKRHRKNNQVVDDTSALALTKAYPNLLAMLMLNHRPQVDNDMQIPSTNMDDNSLTIEMKNVNVADDDINNVLDSICNTDVQPEDDKKQAIIKQILFEEESLKKYKLQHNQIAITDTQHRIAGLINDLAVISAVQKNQATANAPTDNDESTSVTSEPLTEQSANSQSAVAVNEQPLKEELAVASNNNAEPPINNDNTEISSSQQENLNEDHTETSSTPPANTAQSAPQVANTEQEPVNAQIADETSSSAVNNNAGANDDNTTIDNQLLADCQELHLSTEEIETANHIQSKLNYLFQHDKDKYNFIIKQMMDMRMAFHQEQGDMQQFKAYLGEDIQNNNDPDDSNKRDETVTSEDFATSQVDPTFIADNQADNSRLHENLNSDENSIAEKSVLAHPFPNSALKKAQIANHQQEQASKTDNYSYTSENDNSINMTENNSINTITENNSINTDETDNNTNTIAEHDRANASVNTNDINDTNEHDMINVNNNANSMNTIENTNTTLTDNHSTTQQEPNSDSLASFDTTQQEPTSLTNSEQHKVSSVATAETELANNEIDEVNTSPIEPPSAVNNQSNHTTTDELPKTNIDNNINNDIVNDGNDDNSAHSTLDKPTEPLKPQTKSNTHSKQKDKVNKTQKNDDYSTHQPSIKSLEPSNHHHKEKKMEKVEENNNVNINNNNNNTNTNSNNANNNTNNNNNDLKFIYIDPLFNEKCTLRLNDDFILNHFLAIKVDENNIIFLGKDKNTLAFKKTSQISDNDASQNVFGIKDKYYNTTIQKLVNFLNHSQVAFPTPFIKGRFVIHR